MRTIIQIAIAYKFIKKRGWQRKRVRNNQEVCRIELANFLKEKKFENVIN